jgi:hypothetical protein
MPHMDGVGPSCRRKICVDSGFWDKGVDPTPTRGNWTAEAWRSAAGVGSLRQGARLAGLLDDAVAPVAFDDYLDPVVLVTAHDEEA